MRFKPSEVVQKTRCQIERPSMAFPMVKMGARVTKSLLPCRDLLPNWWKVIGLTARGMLISPNFWKVWRYQSGFDPSSPSSCSQLQAVDCGIPHGLAAMATEAAEAENENLLVSAALISGETWPKLGTSNWFPQSLSVKRSDTLTIIDTYTHTYIIIINHIYIYIILLNST